VRRSGAFKLLVLSLLVLPALALAACGGDDKPDVEVIGGVDEEEESPEYEAAAPGALEPKPADAAQVDVTLREWEVAPKQSSVKAGKVYFLVANVGPEDPHEFVVIKSDKAPGSLPFKDNRVPEDEVDMVDEIEPFSPNSSASLVVNLEKGKYVLICNITEQEPDGDIESHYKMGMRTAFTVE
jgi:uncharacterized cupredoxin-like copper-binding protein